MSQAGRAQAVAVALIAATLGAAVLLRGRPEALAAPETKEGKALPRVGVRAPVKKTIRRVVRVVADLLPQADVTVYARTAGYVRKVPVDIGSRVAAGDTLVELDVPELDAALLSATAAVAKAQTAVAEAQAAELAVESGEAEAAQVVKQAEADVDRAKAELAQRTTVRDRVDAVAKSSPNLVAQETLDDARARADVAAAKLRQAEAGVALAQAKTEAARSRATGAKAAVATARANETVARGMESQAKAALAFAKITAPFAGVVAERWVDVGALVKSGSSGSGNPIVRIVDAATLRIRFHVAEPDAPFAQPGRAFKLTVDEASGREFKGAVARVAGALDADTRTMTVEGDLANDDGALRPGMMGRVVLDLEEHKDALVLPAGAVTTVKRKSSVLVVAESKVARRAVKIGADDGIEIEIKDGVAESDQVITAGSSLVSEGDAVEAVPEKTP